MNLAIVKYNAGNVFSVISTLRRLGVEPLLTDDKEAIRGADCVLFPGQGEAHSAMKYLKEHGLDMVIKSLKQPLLGICIGEQLLCKHSEEGNVDCLGIFDTEVKRFQPVDKQDKVPAMGWNRIYDLKSPLFKGLDKERDYVYFVHSYYVPLCKETIATSHHIQPFSAAINKDNFYATQFHIEKSGAVGERIMQNFLDISQAALQ